MGILLFRSIFFKTSFLIKIVEVNLFKGQTEELRAKFVIVAAMES